MIEGDYAKAINTYKFLFIKAVEISKDVFRELCAYFLSYLKMENNNKDIQNWLLKKNNKPFKKRKKYVHFDRQPQLEGKIKVGKEYKSPQNFFEDFFDKNKVAKRAFWPFIHFIKVEKKYKKNLINRKKVGSFENKERDIFYSSYYDSYIYSFYCFLLEKGYEELLEQWDLKWETLAYRRILREDGKGWKNNIFFAREIFEEIYDRKNCYVFAFDITKFFDNLNWDILEKKLCWALGKKELSNDWKNVFNSITKYAFINHEDLSKYDLIKKGIIDSKKFHKVRKKIKRITANGKLVKKTPYYQKKCGIAQWTPISGIMANLYMFDFDLYIKKYIENIWWKYYRYSDDILVVVEYNEYNKEKIYESIQNEVFWYIKKLKLDIQEKKTDIFDFYEGKLIKSFTYNDTEKKFKEDVHIWMLQYLWFSFDWENIYLRNKTLTNHYRRMCINLNRLARLNPFIKDGKIIRKPRYKWWRIKLWEMNKRYSHSWAKGEDNKYWNFYWYVKNAHKIMWELKFWLKSKVKSQMSRYPKNYEKLLIDKKIKKWKQ